MDPITQGALGAAFSQVSSTKKIGKIAWLFGCLGGMAADLDIFIRSESNPLLAIEYHRNFTHSLAFIPVGGFIVFLPFLIFKKFREQWKDIYIACTVGYATHGILDLFTSYGTMILWPFSEKRFAIDNISIIDPLFTIPLIIGVVLSYKKESWKPAFALLCYCCFYLIFGYVQLQRAYDVQGVLASQRNHKIIKARVMPTFANLNLWRAVYESKGKIYSDALYVPFFGQSKCLQGDSRVKFVIDQNTKDKLIKFHSKEGFELFREFSDGWISAIEQTDDYLIIGDNRYSINSNGMDPIWAAKFNFKNNLPSVERISYTSVSNLNFAKIWREILGNDPNFKPVN